MLNTEANKMQYINKLENEIKLLKEENKKLKQVFLSACDKYNISLLQKDNVIATLERELQLSKRLYAMSVLMS